MKQTHITNDCFYDAMDDYHNMRLSYKREVSRYKAIIWYGFIDEPILMK